MRLLAIYFLAVFFFSAAPLAVIYPSASASAGLSIGFLRLFLDPAAIILVCLMGLIASRWERDAMVLLPVGFVLMYVAGALLYFNPASYTYIHAFLLGTILIYGLGMSALNKNRWHIGSYLLAGSLGFQMGIHYQPQIPTLADPLFYLIGQVLSVQLMMAASVSCGFILHPLIRGFFRRNEPEEALTNNM